MGEFEIREYVRQICTGCSYLATNNIVHLDLKPENIVCTDVLDGDINRLKVNIIINFRFPYFIYIIESKIYTNMISLKF